MSVPGEGTGTFSDFAKSLREMKTEEFEFDFDSHALTDRRAKVEVRGVCLLYTSPSPRD